MEIYDIGKATAHINFVQHISQTCSRTKCDQIHIVTNLVTPKAAAKYKRLLNKPTSSTMNG